MTGRRRLGNMTLKELLTRKAEDYGYGTLTEMSRAWGLHPRSLGRIANGEYGLSLEMRQRIVRELDIDPAVIEEVAGK